MGKTGKPQEITLRLGGVTIRFIAGDSNIKFNAELKRSRFFPGDKPEINIHVHPGPIPTYAGGKKVFDSEGAWDLYKTNGSWMIRIGSRKSDNSLAKLAVFDSDFKSGQIYLGSPLPSKHDLINQYLGYPLGHILLSSFLFLNHGAAFHACGVSDKGKGILFVGPSGRGKTTMASLWKNRRGTILLSDERVALRKVKDGYSIYGIPRYGYGMDHFYSLEGARLQKIFFLEQGQKNDVYSLAKDEALSNLLISSFPPVWHAHGMRNILDIFAEIVEEVPCSRLTFVPDRRAVDLVRNSV